MVPVVDTFFFVVANIVIFVITMYVHNCPKNSISCVAGFLRSQIFLLVLLVHFFGLLGGMLSELITNWTIYVNKVAALMTLVVIIIINLAVGILPHVDNCAHIGGFLSGFLVGFVFLIRPQFGWVNQRYAPAGLSTSTSTKFKAYQYVFWVISLIFLIVWFTVGLILLLRGVDLNDQCSWCHYLSCVPTSRWSCNAQPISCQAVQTGSQYILTCSNSSKSRTYSLVNPTVRNFVGDSPPL